MEPLCAILIVAVSAVLFWRKSLANTDTQISIYYEKPDYGFDKEKHWINKQTHISVQQNPYSYKKTLALYWMTNTYNCYTH